MFTTYGDVRGQGPVRETKREARADMRADQMGCQTQGGYSDRQVYAIDQDGYLLDSDGEPVYPVHGRSSGAVRAEM